MSMPEQGAKVATSVVDAMRTQPIMLAVLVLNAIIFLAIMYAVRDQRANEKEIVKALLDQNAKQVEMISKCTVPQRTSDDLSKSALDEIGL